MSPLAYVAVIPAALIFVAAIEAPLLACLIGRWKRRPAAFTDWTLSQPDVPTPPLVVLPADATTERMEQAVFDAFFVDTILREFPEYRKDVTA